MNQCIRLFILLVAPLMLAAACNRAPAVQRVLTDDDLRVMTLTVNDLPPGFRLAEEWLSDNQAYAERLTNPEQARAVLDGWGRAAGFSSLFALAGAPDRPRQPSMIAVSSERFADADHARQAFAEQENLREYAQRPFYARSPYKAPALGRQSAADRMFTTDESGAGLVVYAVTLRNGPIVATVSTSARLDKDDKGAHAIRLARLVAERIDGQLK